MVGRILGSRVVFAVGLLVCSCGGSSESTGKEGSCSTGTPCGGDVVGDWTIKDMCLDISMTTMLQSCPSATFRLSPFTTTGTVSFKANNTMTSSAVIAFQEFIQIPATCLKESDCTLLRDSFLNVTSVTDAQCNWDASAGCGCTVSTSQSTMNSGTYQVQGNNLTTTSGVTGAAETDTFCVSGNTLSIYGVSASGSASSAVFTR
ncbi:MAG TPA: hypothetical protein VER96_27830 [Polyangiaceae bacterium]|nr:hypothetical protein [Polyangiaceae bacterium]